MGTAGTAISQELPAAMGVEDKDITYEGFGLPDSLTFDAATRTISGTPAMADTTEVTYTATAGGKAVELTFSIAVVSGTAPLAFPEDASIDDIGYCWDGVEPLPAAMGGESRSYTVSDLPDGLTFADSTRMISGTPTAATQPRSPVATADAETDTLTFSCQLLPPNCRHRRHRWYGDHRRRTAGCSGGKSEISYSLWVAGGSFADSTRMLSGTLTEEGVSEFPTWRRPATKRSR